jgi:WD40 repeat protein
MMPLALHDDGKHVLMRRNEFGFGNLDRLEIWSIQGKDVVRSLIWIPYEDVNGAPRDVMWAEFVDARTLATSSRGGKVALWDVASAQPICHFKLVDGAVPAMSADRKWIAFSSQDRVGLFNIEKREVVAVQDTPSSFTWPYMAFSPSGRKIGCIARDRILTWDTATGKLEKNFATPGIHIHGAIDFPHDGFILAANQFLIALDTQLKLWQYQGAEYVRTVGGTTFMAVSGFNSPGVLAAAKVPHAEAKSLLEKALKQPDLFVFHQVDSKEGRRTGLEVN